MTFSSYSELLQGRCTPNKEYLCWFCHLLAEFHIRVFSLRICFFSEEGKGDSCFVVMLSHLLPIKQNHLKPDSPAGMSPWSRLVSMFPGHSLHSAPSALQPGLFIPVKTQTLAQKRGKGLGPVPSHLSSSSTCLLAANASSCLCHAPLNQKPQPTSHAWPAASQLPTLGSASPTHHVCCLCGGISSVSPGNPHTLGLS